MATKLSDLQLVLLSTASQRSDGSLLPPPEAVEGQMARIRKAISPLLKRELIEETAVTDAAQVWRADGDARIGLVITAAGRTAIGAEQPVSEPVVDAPVAETTTAPTKAPTKIATVTAMLQRDTGATLWQAADQPGRAVRHPA